MFRFTKNIFCIYISLIIFILPINLKSEPIDDHCHCVNAQQQSFEYLDDIERSGISKSTDALSASTKEILIQEKPEDIWNIVNKGYRIPDPKKKWAKKVVKKVSAKKPAKKTKVNNKTKITIRSCKKLENWTGFQPTN